MVCLLAAPWVQLSVSTGNGWPHNALRHHWLMPISCHFRDCKALLVTSLTHVNGAIASVQTFTAVSEEIRQYNWTKQTSCNNIKALLATARGSFMHQCCPSVCSSLTKIQIQKCNSQKLSNWELHAWFLLMTVMTYSFIHIWQRSAILKIVKSPYLNKKSSDFDEIGYITALSALHDSQITKY